ncbi:MAG: hypothetical protein COX79_00395 [Candidatus Levybacteria bacterium CG_4_10_14_0_2_um_filter_36_16]|nr:MAG: hypothetical protein AUK12_04355 [Candidatus Levybacteria bacterium CG2_30_37_29]PIR79533.1 MAG: hypothetical protein COU26_00675 [Candidatus Levybacteria bacterium CG10_big_fil_rev_8_21_14_0_10_36_30]PIZ97941.1 MAG: hypothetical protein COX79_00395 [Candidatus Levybacteria bacterium CG_4_10_14_0_2_um_filter_36_16]PJA90862.1 MAG: hypothetical protein CO136_00295 [Candidatus Levybacteria bacterium CG_4_9_14_3_um_filter_36_7]
MRSPEHQSISEEFEQFAKTPVALVLLVTGAILGPGAILHAIDLIDQDKIQKALWYTAAGTGEITAAGAIVFANMKAKARPRSFENPQSPEQSNRK